MHRKRKEKIEKKFHMLKKRRKTDILNVYACMLQMNGSMFNGDDDDDDEFECIGMIRILILVQKESIDQIIIIIMIEKI